VRKRSSRVFVGFSSTQRIYGSTRNRAITQWGDYAGEFIKIAAEENDARGDAYFPSVDGNECSSSEIAHVSLRFRSLSAQVHLSSIFYHEDVLEANSMLPS
jgi:hypothetical protein